MNKRLLILAGILTVQCALAATTLAVDRSRAPQPLAPLFEDLEVADITRLEIAESGDDARRVVLARRDDQWVVESHGDYPAKADTIEGFMGKLAGLKSRGPIATSASRHDRLGVGDDDFERKVVLSRGSTTETIYLGRGEGSRSTNLRFADREQTHGVSGISSWEADPGVGRWVDSKFIDVDPEQVASLTVRNGRGEFSVTRRDEETWVLADGREVNANEVMPIVRAAARVNLTEPVAGDEADGFDPNSADAIRVSLTTSDGSTTYAIGSEDGDHRQVKAADRPHVVKVRASSLEKLVSANGEALATLASNSGS